ncbi:MAG: CHAT domain-containing protein [Bacteroidota bacterium]|nr:CHAT domain-containing protein [Bacteroidota bacterium]
MKTFLVFAFFFLVLGHSAVIGQKQALRADTTLARKWYQQAVTLQQKSKYENALELFRKTANLYQKHKLWDQQVNCLNKVTRTLFLMARYEDAFVSARQAVEESQSKLKSENSILADAYNNFGNVYFEKGDLNKAFELTQKALEIRLKVLGKDHPDVAVAYNDLGDIYFDKAEYDLGAEYYEKALQIKLKTLGPEHPDVADSYSSLAFVYRNKNDFDNAFKYYQKALEIWIKVKGEEHPDVGYTYHNLGILYYFKEEYDKALEYNNKGLSIRTKTLPPDHPDLAASYNNRGSIFKAKGDFDQAVTFYQKALQIRLNSLGEVHRNVAASYNNLGVAYYEKGDFDQAIEYYQKALQLWIKLLGEEHPDITLPYKNLGNVYKEKGDITNALAYNYKALQIELDSPGKVLPAVASTYNDIGELYAAKRDYNQALRQFQKAILVNIPSFQDSIISHNPILSRKVSTNLYEFNLLKSFQLKGNTFEKLFTRNGNIANLQLAYQNYCSADTLLGQILFNYTGENDKVAFTQKTRQIYQVALPVCLKLHQLTKEKNYLDKAFYFSERGKAMVLSASLAESKAKNFAGIADSLLNLDQQLRTRIASYTQQIAQELTSNETADSTKLNEYQTLLFTAHRQQERLNNKLEKEYPQYFHLKYRPANVTAAQLQNLLDEKTALLEYALGDSLLHIFTLTRHTFDVKSFSIDHTFHRKIAAFRKAILSQEEDLYQEVAYSLYNTLLPSSLPKSIRQLLIIPEGELTTLPFEALLTQKSKSKTAKSYLLNKYAISYAYSAPLLYERLNQPQQNSTKQLLAFAPVFADTLTSTPLALNRLVLAQQNPDSGNYSKLPVGKPEDYAAKFKKPNNMRGWLLNGQYVSPLLASKREVETIAQLFQEKGNAAKIYLNDQAREEQLKSRDLSSSNYLHLATHGFVNESFPELSGLLLAQNGNSKEDGILYMGEIYNLNLKADLVTLSACETGLGKIASGEGVIGLTRALLYAGARNVVVSFWKVPDTSTADLMENFYAALLSGEDKAQALQTAKLNLAKHRKYNHPFYWAPFVLIGK